MTAALILIVNTAAALGALAAGVILAWRALAHTQGLLTSAHQALSLRPRTGSPPQSAPLHIPPTLHAGSPSPSHSGAKRAPSTGSEVPRVRSSGTIQSRHFAEGDLRVDPETQRSILEQRRLAEMTAGPASSNHATTDSAE